jgi:hypothetical protein
MRTSIKVLAAGAVGTLGLLAFATTPAMASVAAPDCESGASTVVCDALAGTSPYTWTVTEHFEGTSSTSSYTTTVPTTKLACVRGQSFIISYSYTSGGVTQTSNTAVSSCNTGPWP